MSKGYSATLTGGQEIFVPTWPPMVALENLTRAGEYIGTDNLIRISDLSTAAVILAITESTDSKETAGLIQHFVCTARIDGNKITPDTFTELFEDNLYLICEIFAHVVKGVYSDFFAQGLVKEPSQKG